MQYSQHDFRIKTLGSCRVASPLKQLLDFRQHSVNYVEESDRIVADNTRSAIASTGVPAEQLPGLEPAGSRRMIYFDPSNTRVGIVTCGGLCPGLNNVIRSLVVECTRRYGVSRVFGFCNGFQGFIPACKREVLELTPESVADIHEHGGTVLGSSRGEQSPEDIADCLERMGINILFVIGGDGTIRGAMQVVEEISRRQLKIAVVGVPKTIDNDINFIDQSFGFQTAFSEGAKAIRAAHVEACGAPGRRRSCQTHGTSQRIYRLLRVAR